MKAPAMISIAVLFGCTVFADTRAIYETNQLFNQYAPFYYYDKSGMLAWNQRTHIVDDFMSIMDLNSGDPLMSVSGASQLFSSISGQRESVIMRAIGAFFDMLDVASPNPFLSLYSVGSIVRAFKEEVYNVIQ